ncbi:ABC transporter ATP-binding protein [Streptococcus minor]|uniref:ABC-type quaternary amine transporter n=1 Tax=Streptococcus minor TaxID=229549 RepID=A0A3P1VE54_9STRE|nr:ABC transporter ATP-binding protein [Streptococcus minor]RRD31926.1 ABC transporter ATP-binding protein [Streptococcus minor]
MATETIISFQEVSKIYNEKTVVEQVSLAIQKGEFITILGTSGSGKTTILKMMNRLIEPTSGKILFEGEELSQLDAVSLRRRVGYVVQQIGLFPHMTIGENIATVPKLLKWNQAEINARVKELMNLIQLPYEEYSNRYPKELSGGQQQRVGVARALAANPDVVLFDEPFGAIDAITRSSLQEELRNIHRQLGDKTFIFITHDIYEAFRLGSRVLIMDEGKICQFDSPEQIIQSPQGAFVANLIETVKEQEKIWRTYA